MKIFVIFICDHPCLTWTAILCGILDIKNIKMFSFYSYSAFAKVVRE